MLEVVYDGKAEAANDVKVAASRAALASSTMVKLNTSPPEPAIVAQLAKRYSNPLLGEITLIRNGSELVLNAGEWHTALATRKNASGSGSLISTAPTLSGLKFIIGNHSGKRTLSLGDSQNEYRFTEI